MYFDVDGVFHYELIPSKDSDPIRIGLDSWKDSVISEEITVDFENVKNAIEVYGVTHETEYFSDSSITTVSGANISLTINPQALETEYMIVSFVLPSAVNGNITINVNGWGAKNLVDENGNRITHLAKDTYWTISYQSNGTWLFMGHLQAQGYWADINPESPFCFLIDLN